MKRKLFTFLVAFLATLSGAVWGQTPTEIDISATSSSSKEGMYAFTYTNTTGEKSRKLTISAPGSYTLKGSEELTDGNNSNVQISITTAGTYYITLNNVKVDASLENDLQGYDGDPKHADRCAFQIGDDNETAVIVYLSWTGTNKLWSGGERAGINVKPGATLIVNDEDNNGTLEVGCYTNSSGSTYGAGIGGDKVNPSFGTIIIESGTITAKNEAYANSSSMAYGAGIGGGYKPAETPNAEQTSTEGTIIIKDGTVTAECATKSPASLSNEYGAGIGGGYKGTCENITIIGGTIKGDSQQGDDLGNGQGYTGTTKPDVIIAPESGEDDAAPNVTGTVGTNVDKLVVNDSGTTISGEVVLPAGTQVYAPNIQKTNDSDKILGYNIKLTNEEKISGEAEDGDSGDHSIKNFPETQSDIYYGASESETNKTKVSIPVNVSCSWGHHFMGWYSLKENSTDEYEIKEAASEIEIPTTDPTDTQVLYEGAAVWVDDYLDIVVANLHEWKQDDASTNPSTISVIPEDAASLLTFTLKKGTKAGNRLDDVKLYNDNSNIFVGTPSIVYPTESYADLDDVTVSVKVTSGTSDAKTIKTPIFIHSGNLVVTGVEVVTPHTYNGEAHNNKEDDANHAFKFTVKVEGDDIDLPADFTLTEGVHYVVESYTLTVGSTASSETPTEIKGSAQIIDAGTYSSIKLKAVKDADPDRDEYSIKFKIGDNAIASDEYTIPTELVVNPKDLTLKANTESIEISNGTDPNFTANWDDYVSIDGIVTINGTKDEVTPTVTASVTPATTGNWWEVPGNYAVTFTLDELTGDDASNYSKENTTTVVRNIIVKGDAADVTITPGDGSAWDIEGEDGFNHVYDRTVPKIGTLVIATEGGNLEILTEDEGFTVIYPTDANVGTKTATVTFINSQYITDNATATISLNITARPLNITFKEEVASMEGLTVTDLVVPDNLVSGEIPTYNGTIQSEETGENTYKVTITGFKVENSTTFTSTNYVIKVNGNDYTEDETIVIDKVTVDPDDEGDDDHNPGHGGSTGGIDRPAKYYNIYVDTAATSDGVELSLSKDVVKEGNQVSVYIDKILEGYNAENMKVQIKRSLYGYWEEIEEGVQPGEYIIYNIYHDIYVKVTDVVKEDATGIDDLEGVKAYAKDGSIYVYTPNREEVTIISMSGAIIKNEEQVGLQSYSVSRGIYIVRIGDKVFKLKN